MVLGRNSWLFRIEAMYNHVGRMLEAYSHSSFFPSIVTAIIPSLGPEPPYSQFLEMATVVETSLARLVFLATTATADLNKLDTLLNALKALVLPEMEIVVSDKEALLTHIWTRLGGNRNDIQRFQSQIKLLDDILVHR